MRLRHLTNETLPSLGIEGEILDYEIIYDDGKSNRFHSIKDIKVDDQNKRIILS